MENEILELKEKMGMLTFLLLRKGIITIEEIKGLTEEDAEKWIKEHDSNPTKGEEQR